MAEKIYKTKGKRSPARRTFILVAVIIAVFSITTILGCGGGGDDDFDFLGLWSVNLWFNPICGGAVDSTSTFNIFANNTFTDGFGNTGTWSQNGDEIVLTIVGQVVLTGRAQNSNTVTGTYIAGGTNGCWVAIRL